MAIVVVVSIIALLTLLVIAFLFTSSSNRNISSIDVATRQADSIATLARETIVADIVAEMKAGSTKVVATADGKNSFTVETAKAMVPERAVKSAVLSDPRFKRIVKQSAGGTKFHNIAAASAPASARASNVSTATTAVDGRKFAESRWGAPRLLESGLNPTVTQVPDWIYVTRSGGNPTNASPPNSTSAGSGGAPSAEYIVGRYAYQVYDISGLLDINAAGSGTGAPALDKSRKGSLLWADLTVLPGASTGILKLADWRHPAGGSSALRELVIAWGQPYGWLRTPLIGGRSDNTFINRRDLITYQKSNSAVIPDAILPYLTSFSMELNQPSWAPAINAGGAFDYKANKDEPAAVNRRLLSVRVGSEFTRLDGSLAKVGEPLVKSRFPLSRLRAFTDKNREDIEKYFGLTEVAGAGGTTWRYRGQDTPNILTLEQVAARNREPDFFEMLKAGLLEGSLANVMTDIGFFQDTGRDNKSTYQILRIGASVIDQWDADDDPTIIQYGLTNPLTGLRVDDVAGVENLPYFHFLGESRFRRRDTASPPNDSIAATFITFQLWNPHKNVADGKVAAGSFRIAFDGISYMDWNTSSSNGEAGYTPYIRQSSPRTASFASDYIDFTVGSGATSFSNPLYLKPGVAGATSSKTIDTISGGGAPVIGYNVGQITAPYLSTGQHPQRYFTNGMFARYNRPMVFALQKNVGGKWLNYQIIPDWTRTHGFVIGSLMDNTNRLYAAGGDYVNLHAMFIDPRTTRYGLSTTTQGVDALNKTTGNRTYDNKYFPPANWTNPGGRRPQEFQANASSGSNSRIVNRDNKRRPADAGAPFTTPSERPEILNRPFQSVADMGLAFRDDPWTSLNFFGDPEDPENPGDGALLDFFSLTESPVRAGVVNPNSAPAEILETLLSQAAIREGATLTSTQAKAYAQAIRTELDAKPLLNPGEISDLAGKVTKTVPVADYKNHKDRHVIARALTDTANIRTWNLLVDVVAQSGNLTPGANSLDRFINRAERRYWYHLAIDRFTGEIVASQREIVAE